MELRHGVTLFETHWMSGLAGEGSSGEAASRQALVTKAAAGDPAAFERIVVENERRVLNLALRLLGEMAQAEDAAQEVFLRAFKYLHRFDARKPLRPWLTRITVNVCRDALRKRRPLASEELREDAVAVPDTESPHNRLAAEQQRTILWKALGQLPEKERAAVVLRDLEGLSTQEAAEVLGSSAATVRSQISSARLKLRTSIGRIRGKKP